MRGSPVHPDSGYGPGRGLESGVVSVHCRLPVCGGFKPLRPGGVWRRVSKREVHPLGFPVGVFCKELKHLCGQWTETEFSN